MKCPECNKLTECGCGNCKKRNKTPILRPHQFVKDGNFIKCPYCKVVKHYEIWVYSDLNIN